MWGKRSAATGCLFMLNEKHALILWKEPYLIIILLTSDIK